MGESPSAVSRRKKPPVNEKYSLYEPFPSFLIVHHFHWVMLGEDRGLAIVFAALAYISNGKVIADTAAGEDREPWFEAGLSHIADLTLGMTEKTVSGHIKKLSDRGLLTVKEPTSGKRGVTYQYLLHYESINARIRELYPIGKTTDDIGKVTDDSSVKLPDFIGKVTDAYKEETILNNKYNKQEENSPSPLSQEEKALKPKPIYSAPADDTQKSYDLQDDSTVLEFVKNAYNQARRFHSGKDRPKISNADLKRFGDRIQQSERTNGMSEFRTGLWRFLEGSSDWLRQNKWPIAAYLKDPTGGFIPELAPIARYRAAGAEIPGLKPAPVSDQTNYLQYVDRWNTVIPELPCGNLQPFEIKLVESAIKKGEFQPVFEEVLAKIALIIRHNLDKADEFTFASLFDGFIPKWQKVYMGTYNWATKPKGGKSVSDIVADNFERQERQERERQAQAV